MAEAAVTAPPSPEDRQQAIDILAQEMTGPDMTASEAEAAAAQLVDAAIEIRKGKGEESGEGSGDTEPD